MSSLQIQDSDFLDSELLEKNLVTHLRVLQHLIPANDFDIQVDITHPLKPAETVGHRSEVLFTLKPRFDF